MVAVNSIASRGEKIEVKKYRGLLQSYRAVRESINSYQMTAGAKYWERLQ